MTHQPDQGGVLSGPWIWLLPASYAVHIVEEGLAGERFYHWIQRTVGREVGGRTFLAVNVAYETMMGAAVWCARNRADFGWVVATMGTITAINGVGHVAGRPSHPKLFARIGVGKNRVDPLGLFAVVRARRFLPREVWRRSIAAGVAINAGIGLLALPLSRKVVRRIDDGSGESIT